MRTNDISNLQAKVDKLEVEGDKLRATVREEIVSEEGQLHQRLQQRNLSRKLLLKKAVKAVAEEVKAK